MLCMVFVDDARHTHANLTLRASVHLKVVQERLWHSSIEMTLDIYSHISHGHAVDIGPHCPYHNGVQHVHRERRHVVGASDMP